MITSANIPIYVKLVSSDHLSVGDARVWFQVVNRVAPQGTVAAIDWIDANGQPAKTRVVRRSIGQKTELIIPLTRDLVPSELEKISDEWSKVSPPMSYTITTNPTQSQKMVQDMDGLSLSSDEYQRLCMQLAKVRHDGWVREKTDSGWRYGQVLNLTNKTHPMLRPWDELPKQYRDVDTKNPENFLNFINNQGFAVVRKEELASLLKLMRDVL